MNKIARRLYLVHRIAEKMTSEEIARRNKKVDSLRNLSKNISKIRHNLAKDLKSDDEKVKLTALVISIMDKTAERVGNEESAKNDHVGVTGFKKKNVSVNGNIIKFKYTGKSGVKHEKDLTDKKLAPIIKELLKRAKKDNDSIFVTEDEFKIKADRVNRYLKDFGVKAKDIRGYAANRFMIDALKSGKKSSDEKERKKRFLEVLKTVSEKVGHGLTMLRKSYLLPNIENDYIIHGKIKNLKEI